MVGFYWVVGLGLGAQGLEMTLDILGLSNRKVYVGCRVLPWNCNNTF